MKIVFRIAIALTFVTVLHLNTLPKAEACGPDYLAPVFDYSYAPERPWTDFAGGKLGIIKPGYRRIVLFAAYRYLNGSGFGGSEQNALVEAWEAQFNHKEPQENSVEDAVKEWLRERRSVIGEEEKTPEIYADKRYGEGYSFFPNCSKNAFEVAAKTLAERAAAYGSDSKDVKEWILGQDRVFTHCSTGGDNPAELDAGSPEWLRKDRDYQLAAASFYSTDYEDARRRFEKIAADNDSPWRELADYLVARTLVRQAGGGEDDKIFQNYNQRAEEYLNQLAGRAVTYQNDTRRLLNLVKYRIHPEQRVRELAQKLPYQNDSAELRQDLIDYTWLLDQLESETLKKEETRKEKEKAENSNISVTQNGAANSSGNSPDIGAWRYEKIQKGEVLNFYIDTTPPVDPQSNTGTATSSTSGFTYDVNMSNEEIIQATEQSLGRSLTEAEVAKIASARKESYSNKISYKTRTEYKGGYYGTEELRLELLPAFLSEDPLSEWLFTFQIQNDEAYFHALKRWKETSSDMWLMTAMVKAGKNLGGLKELMDAAKLVSPDSPAFYTIAYHQTRILMDTGKKDEARKLLAKILDEPRDMPVSTRNLFTEQRMKVSETLSEFIKCALRKPFGFSYEEDTARSIDDIIAERKSWFDPDDTETSQAEFDLEIEKEFADKRPWQDRLFFDEEVVDIINQNFPTSLMLETLNKPELPDYLKRRLTLAVWTRAYLLKDEKTTLAVAPAVVALKPGIEPLMAAYVNAKTPAERETAGLFLLLKTGDMSPYIYGGFDSEPEPQFDMWQDERWWCEQYDYDYDDSGNQVPKAVFMPPFLTKELSDKAKLQRAALKKNGDGLSYLSGRVMKWAQTGVPDRRLPEALYLIFQANQWVKYSCGTSDEETRNKASNILKTRYPRSKWTAKMFEDLKENEN
jgi:hypothetical protein